MEPIWSNSAATRLIEGGDVVMILDGRLACAAAALRSEFRAFVTAAKALTSVWVYHPAPGQPVLVQADLLLPEGQPPGIALMFHSTHANAGYMWADLGKAFGLTRSEEQVVKRVVSGERAATIAQELGITLETVRTHIRRIYGKLEISSREELFSLLNPYRVR